MSQRYSDEAMAKVRAMNQQRFLDQAKIKYGDRFDYSHMEYITQKIPVTIGCPDHGWFEITPDNYLRNGIMGCPKCGRIHASKRKFQTHKQRFYEKFKKYHSDRLKLITDYQGVTSPITVECLAEGHRFKTTPDRLNQYYKRLPDQYFKDGCPICTKKARVLAMMKSQKQFIQEVQEKFPDLDFSRSQYQGSSEPITFVCPKHGKQTSRAATLLNKSPWGCRECAKAHIGYAGYRIRQLLSGKVEPRPTRIALMKMNIWGIRTYKLGTTTRILEARYREFLVKVYFEAVLDELDALMLESLLKVKYKDDQDLRVKKKGMRDGERWSGDEELFFKRAVEPMLADLRVHVKALSKKDPHYWYRFPELELPDDKPRESTFTEGEYGKPRPVICLDNKKVYLSASEAARQLNTSQGNLSMVCRGERRHVKGFRFAYLDDYENRKVPTFTPSTGRIRPVRCIDTGEVFASLTEAAKAKGVDSGKITMVCKGKRKSTGRLRWEYVHGS